VGRRPEALGLGVGLPATIGLDNVGTALGSVVGMADGDCALKYQLVGEGAGPAMLVTPEHEPLPLQPCRNEYNWQGAVKVCVIWGQMPQ